MAKKTDVPQMEEPMWLRYVVTLRMQGRFAAALPKTVEEIEKMLENRMPKNPPPNYTPVGELAQQVAEKVGIDTNPGEEPEEPGEGTEKAEKFGWATFPRNEKGEMYFEGRCIRGHLKDCANQVKDILRPPVTALKAKLSNKVYVMTEEIPLVVLKEYSWVPATEVTGTQERFIQVMTHQGPRSTIKYIDYLEKPMLSFNIQVLNDGVITEGILRTILDYGSVHGTGQERSQGWGRYTYTIDKIG